MCKVKQERLQLDPTRSNSLKSISTAGVPVKQQVRKPCRISVWQLDAGLGWMDAWGEGFARIGLGCFRLGRWIGYGHRGDITM